MLGNIFITTTTTKNCWSGCLPSKLNQCNSISIVTRLQAEQSLIPGRGSEVFFLLTTTSRWALGPTQPPIQWVPWVPSSGVKWPRCEINHSPPFCAEVKNVWNYIFTPPYIFML
jgi:hypothetical protein